MNEKQYQEFQYIVQQCESGEFNSINVGSKVRSDAIVAAWQERVHLYGALREVVEASSLGDGARFSIAIAEARKVLGDSGGMSERER